MIYPVITLYQPWATWIIRGWKTIETRNHSRFESLIHKTILIHAGQQTDASDLTLRNKFLTREQLLYKPEDVINGAILGSVYVDACGWLSGHYCEDSAALIETNDKYGLFLTKINRFKDPIPAKGKQGIWYYDLDFRI